MQNNCEILIFWNKFDEDGLKLKDRGMNAPQLAIGDGALGFWRTLEEVYSTTRHQRCWVHKTANILNNLPKSSQPKAKQSLHEI